MLSEATRMPAAAALRAGIAHIAGARFARAGAVQYRGRLLHDKSITEAEQPTTAHLV